MLYGVRRGGKDLPFTRSCVPKYQFTAPSLIVPGLYNFGIRQFMLLSFFSLILTPLLSLSIYWNPHGPRHGMECQEIDTERKRWEWDPKKIKFTWTAWHRKCKIRNSCLIHFPCERDSLTRLGKAAEYFMGSDDIPWRV